MKQLLILLLILAVTTITSADDLSSDKKTLQTRQDRISYSLGFQIGRDFEKQNTDIDSETFLAGVQDALASANPGISQDEMSAILLKMKKKVLAQQQTERKEARENLNDSNKNFMEENSLQQGVVKLPSGLQYRIIHEGNGPSPRFTDKVSINYRGTLSDGTEIGSSQRKKGTSTFRVNKVMPGMAEALQLMQTGAKWQLFLPPELAFGYRGTLAGRTLIYELELVAIKSD